MIAPLRWLPEHVWVLSRLPRDRRRRIFRIVRSWISAPPLSQANAKPTNGWIQTVSPHNSPTSTSRFNVPVHNPDLISSGPFQSSSRFLSDRPLVGQVEQVNEVQMSDGKEAFPECSQVGAPARQLLLRPADPDKYSALRPVHPRPSGLRNSARPISRLMDRSGGENFHACLLNAWHIYMFF